MVVLLKIPGWLSALAGLAALFSGGHALACKVAIVGEIPVAIDHGRAVIDGEINGRQVRMAVDTGSTSTVLLRASASRLGLFAAPVESLKFYAIGADPTAEYVHLDRLHVGKLIARNLDWVLAGELDRPGGVDGLLGADFFTQTNADVEFDLPHHVIRLLSPTLCFGDEVVYWGGAVSMTPLLAAIDGAPEFLTKATIEGVPLEVLLDSGVDTTLTGQGARKLGLRLPDRNTSGATAGNTETPSMVQVRFGDLTLDREVIHNPVLKAADVFGAGGSSSRGARISSGTEGPPDLLLGADFLLTHRLYVARSQERIYITYAGGSLLNGPPSWDGRRMVGTPGPATPP